MPASPFILRPALRLLLPPALLLTAGCLTEPFSYAADRCAGAYNQCQTNCTSINTGPARAACHDRCYAQEDRCYGTGDDSASALAVDRAVGAARNRREMEDDFQRWKAQRAAESAEKDEEAEAGETAADD